MPRFYCPCPLQPGVLLELPAGAARHVQVLRLQPGDGITLFNGEALALDLSPNGLMPPELTAAVSGEYSATVTHMGRSTVQVQVGEFVPTQREATRRVHLALGMPANERMDWLVEKATELGVASIQPLMTERTVLRLSGERADKKQAHWQSVAVAACEQCGGNQVPQVHAVMTLADWLKTPAAPALQTRLLLSLRNRSQGLRDAMARAAPFPGFAMDRTLFASDDVNASTRTSTGNLPASGCTEQLEVTFLSGPEGGLSLHEESAALAAGFAPVTLGPRVLRAETAALAALAALLLE
jgi:16S rRNA (uracil1498-N3)-methyltransferase